MNESVKITNTPLETHRFSISPDSLRFMEEVARHFQELQKKYPELRAMSFFGSRIRGQERKEKVEGVVEDSRFGKYYTKIPVSDLDASIFFDESRVPPQKSLEEGELVRSAQFSTDFWLLQEEVRKKTGLPISLNVDGGLDVSPAGMKEKLSDFKNTAKRYTLSIPIELPRDFERVKPLLKLSAFFCLAIGDINQHRKFILDDFGKDPDGEFYWETLMVVLSEFERPQGERLGKTAPVPSYDKYPKTLAEGRKYFLSNQNNSIRLAS